MPPKRSAIPMSRADSVRHIWAEFEAWQTEQLALLDERIAKALREIDQNRKPIVGKKKSKGKDKEKADGEHEKKKQDARIELEKTFDGDKVREEWQNRLQRAGLVDEDWGVMTANEQRKIEKILGLDLDITEGDVTIIEAGPPQPPAPHTATQCTSPPSLHTSPLSNSSRMDAISDNYAFVDPASFHVPETVEASPFDNWLEVRQRIKNDDEVSLDASTTSSWGGGGEVPAYLAWSSEISRSSAQSSQTSLSGSPERAAKMLPEHSQSNLLSSAVNRLALFGDSQWNSGVLGTKRPNDAAHLDNMPGGFPSMTTFDNFSSDTQMSRAVPSAKPSKSRTGHRYIGPELVDDEEKAEAEEFMECKLQIRVGIIREFHEEAAEAGIRLARALANEIQNGTSSKERTARMSREHEEEMLALRESKERKRKQLVEKERQERLVKFQQRKRKQTQTHATPQLPPPPQNTSPDDYPFDQSLLTEKFLRELSHGPDANSAPQPNVSETPTIRSQLNRLRVPVISDWLSGAGSTAAASAGASTDSGTDTPTPTMKSSGWKVKETPTLAPTLNDAPSFKRLPSGLAQSVSANSTSATVDDVQPLPDTNAPKKSDNKSGRTNNKTKKEKTQTTVTQTEEASSSKTKIEQVVQKSTKVDPLRSSPKHSPPISANTSTSLSSLSSPPPPVPLSTRPDIPATPAPPMPMFNVSAPTPLMESIYRMPTLAESQNHAPPQLPSLTHAPQPQPQLQPQPQPQPQPQAHHHLSATVADSHKRWVPPAAMTVDKRPHASRTTTELPSQIKKSNTSQSTLLEAPEASRRERRMSDPVSPSPRSFDYPNGKIAAKANDAPASILKKATVANTAMKTAGSKPSAKVKKVTIEDVKDEEEVRVETLPSDSRHIMEPKPVAAPNMYSQIFQFGEDDKGVKEKEKERALPPQTASRPPPQAVAVQVRRQESDSSTSSSSSASLAAPKSNQMWIPPQASMAEAAKPKSSQALSTTSASTRGPTHFDDPSEKHVRWGGATAFKQKKEESGDSFLAGLDQLMKAVGQEEKDKESSHKLRPRAVESGWSAAGKSAAGNLFWDPNAKNTHRKPVATS